jgi:hypothetical protein
VLEIAVRLRERVAHVELDKARRAPSPREAGRRYGRGEGEGDGQGEGEGEGEERARAEAGRGHAQR